MHKDVKDLVTRMAICKLIYVEEYKGLIFLLKCTIIKKNYYAYLILAFIGHGGHCKAIANVVISI